MEIPLAPPASTNVFVAQPIAQTYMVKARAVAAALLWRVMGVNTGHGFVGRYGSPAGARSGDQECPVDHAGAGYPMMNPDVALSSVRSPSHALQVIVAEWLQVFVSICQHGGVVTMSSVAWGVDDAVFVAHEHLPTFTSVDDVSALLDAHAEHEEPPAPFVWTPAVMLQFMADWVGGALPLHASLYGDPDAFQAAVDPFLALADSLRPRGSILRRHAGTSPASLTEFTATLSRILQTHAGLLAVGVIVLDASAFPTTEVLIADATSAHDAIPNAPVPDDADMEALSATAYLPVAMTVPDADTLQALTDGRLVGVVRGKGDCASALLSSGAPTPPLLHIVLESAGFTMASVLPGAHTSVTGRHHLRDLDALRAAAAELFCTTADSAVAAVATAFWDRFRHQHWAARQTVDLPALLIETPLEGKVVQAPKETRAIHLYYLPSVFMNVIRRAGPLVTFLEALDMRGDGTGTGTLALLHHGVPVATLVPLPASPKKYTLSTVHADARAPPSGTPTLLLPMLWSVVFSREDVLAIALSGPKAHQIFKQLFVLRMERLKGSRLQPATDSIGASLCSGTLFETGQGATLRKAVVAEIVLQMDQLQEGQALLDALQRALTCRVAEVRGRHDTYVVDVDADIKRDVITAHGCLDVVTGTVTPLDPAITVAVDSVVAWSEPMLCGIVLAANSAAVAAALGAQYVLDSMQELEEWCGRSVINDFALQEDTEEAKRRLRQLLDARRP